MCEKEFNDFLGVASRSMDPTKTSCPFVSCLNKSAMCVESEYASAFYLPKADPRLQCIALVIDGKATSSMLATQMAALDCEAWAVLAPRSSALEMERVSLRFKNVNLFIADDSKALMSSVPEAASRFHRNFLFVVGNYPFPTKFASSFAHLIECDGFDGAEAVGFASVSSKSNSAFFARSEFVRQLFGALLSPSRELPSSRIMCKMAHLFYSAFDKAIVGCMRPPQDEMFVPLDEQNRERDAEYEALFPVLKQSTYMPDPPKCAD